MNSISKEQKMKHHTCFFSALVISVLRLLLSCNFHVSIPLSGSDLVHNTLSSLRVIGGRFLAPHHRLKCFHLHLFNTTASESLQRCLSRSVSHQSMYELLQFVTKVKIIKKRHELSSRSPLLRKRPCDPELRSFYMHLSCSHHNHVYTSVDDSTLLHLHP
jgi:hypothetical protein